MTSTISSPSTRLSPLSSATTKLFLMGGALDVSLTILSVRIIRSGRGLRLAISDLLDRRDLGDRDLRTTTSSSTTDPLL